MILHAGTTDASSCSQESELNLFTLHNWRRVQTHFRIRKGTQSEVLLEGNTAANSIDSSEVLLFIAEQA
jgi:hypothetical protein